MSRRNGFSEKWLELRLARALEARGLSNFHMSSPSLPGIPDRYVIGANGLWVEVKQGESYSELRSGFDRQRTFLTKLDRGGDGACICALWQPPQDHFNRRLFLEPWSVWLERERQASRHAGWGFDKYNPMYHSPVQFTRNDLRDLDAGLEFFASYCHTLTV